MIAESVDSEKRLAQLKRQVLGRGVERYPSILKNISDLPVELQSAAVTERSAGEIIQTVIYFPPQIQHGWDYVPKQALLFTDTNVIHLLASIWPDQEPQITTLSNSGLLYLNATLILLYGFLEIVAQGPDSPTRISVEFNAVFWDCLSPPLRKLLQPTNGGNATTMMERVFSPAVRSELEKLPLKFSNGVGIHGVLPGEELEDLVFQRGIWKRRLLLFSKPVTANTLLLLTSNYMVILREEPGIHQGWIVSYLRWNRIAVIQNQTRNSLSELTIQLESQEQTAEYKLMLTSEAAQIWQERWVEHGGLWQETGDEIQK